MNQKEQTVRRAIAAYCKQFRTAGILNSLDTLIHQAEVNASGFMDFTLQMLQAEAQHRHQNEVIRRRKAAQLPHKSDLDSYDHNFENGLHKNQLNQLRELNWLDQGYNIMLMGPSGVGKMFIAAGLCSDAIDKGYKAYFRTMEDITSMLKMKDVTRSAGAHYRRLAKADLIVIDDIMLFPVEKNQAVALFNFFNQLYENTGSRRQALLSRPIRCLLNGQRCWMMKCWLPLCWTDSSTVGGHQLNWKKLPSEK